MKDGLALRARGRGAAAAAADGSGVAAAAAPPRFTRGVHELTQGGRKGSEEEGPPAFFRCAASLAADTVAGLVGAVLLCFIEEDTTGGFPTSEEKRGSVFVVGVVVVAKQKNEKHECK